MGGSSVIKRCRLELCPAKRSCARNPASGVPILPDQEFDAFAIMAGEVSCAHYMSVNRYNASIAKMSPPVNTVDPAEMAVNGFIEALSAKVSSSDPAFPMQFTAHMSVPEWKLLLKRLGAK